MLSLIQVCWIQQELETRKLIPASARNPFVFPHLIILKVLSSKWWLGGSIPCARASCRMSMSFLQPCASFSNLQKRQTNNRKAPHATAHQTEHSPGERPQSKSRNRPESDSETPASLLPTHSHNEQLTNLTPIIIRGFRQNQAWPQCGWLTVGRGAYRVVSATFPRCINCLEYCKHLCQHKQNQI